MEHLSIPINVAKHISLNEAEANYFISLFRFKIFLKKNIL